MREMKFGENLKILIKMAGYTVSEFADELGVASNTLYRYCNDTMQPVLMTAARASELLRVDLHTLVYADLKNHIEDYSEELKHYKVTNDD